MVEVDAFHCLDGPLKYPCKFVVGPELWLVTSLFARIPGVCKSDLNGSWGSDYPTYCGVMAGPMLDAKFVETGTLNPHQSRPGKSEAKDVEVGTGKSG